MRKLIATAALAVFALATVSAGPNDAPPDGIDYELEVAKGETGTVEGPSDAGGTTLDDNDPEGCSSSDPTWMCERVLVEFTGTGNVVADFASNYPSDYDLDVYKSDKAGTMGESITQSSNPYPRISAGCTVFCVEPSEREHEHVEWETKKGEWALIVIYYYLAGGGYTLDVSLA